MLDSYDNKITKNGILGLKMLRYCHNVRNIVMDIIMAAPEGVLGALSKPPPQNEIKK